MIIISTQKRLFYSNLPNNFTVNNNEKNISSNFDVLLIYIYANTHSYAFQNLKYFVDVAVRENDGVDYYFILQRVDNKPIDESLMPQLPKRNGHYIQHDNICYDFGTIGWFFNEYTYGNPWINQTNIDNKINLNSYKYFILMNASIRGPIFPPYFLKFLSDYKNDFKKTFYWYYVFTKRINSRVKLVGPTISCAHIPHVQSYFVVTDFIGLKLLLQPGTLGGTQPKGIFGCYEIKNDVSLFSEVAASTRIIQSGYLIDSVLTRYQKINFNRTYPEICSTLLNPYADNYFDGTSLEPFEVVFVKYADLEYAQLSRERAKLYQRWMQDATNIKRTIW